MNNTIDAFIADKKIAIAGASPKNTNFGLHLMKEFTKRGYEVFPVNPNYDNINGTKCFASVTDLPDNVAQVILAVNPAVAKETVEQSAGTHVKRLWFVKGVGAGAHTDEAIELCKANNIEYVYGFCPMMFFGKGMHKFHLWMRKSFGKVPVEFSKN